MSETPLLIVEKDSSTNSYCQIATIKNNEDQAHGDDTHIELIKVQENLLTNSQSDISSNELLAVHDENFHISSYDKKENDINLNDILLRRQQRSPIDICEFEVDLGNGQITKSISSYQTDDKQQRTKSILSVDSIQPTTTSRVPFTSQMYNEQIYPKHQPTVDHHDELNILFNSHDHIKQRQSKFSFPTVTMLTAGTTIVILIIVVIFFIF
ncbi:unnamed protein product [Rotaria magnacalcarata]|uniref:Uncharacterized protein n=1 Tax=Rotaria magnacalcarata TaxID=392030 RepID=A0A815R1G8_9BILA|nr:unnamed protein product [Rotaria magnacalcarata]CAF1589579.1 unnamed protein product [Rotaria magnacalcarata]CAF1925664.1 unnamed protein product [Rotaria magnacalcarata]CAF1971898.1 unnamed protein product [Rotaria magnacalcarata]CAF3877911.1 unnamed protein product [Rotaria magnacalcarata]